MFSSSCDVCGFLLSKCLCKGLDLFFQNNRHLFKYDPMPKTGLKKAGVSYPRLYMSKCVVCFRFPCSCRARMWS